MFIIIIIIKEIYRAQDRPKATSEEVPMLLCIYHHRTVPRLVFFSKNGQEESSVLINIHSEENVVIYILIRWQ